MALQKRIDKAAEDMRKAQEMREKMGLAKQNEAPAPVVQTTQVTRQTTNAMSPRAA